LAKHHSTLTEAEYALGIDYMLETSNDINFVDHISSTPKQFPQTNVEESLSPIFNCLPQKKASISNIGDMVKNLVFAFQNTMTKRLKMQLLRYLYKQVVNESGGTDRGGEYSGPQDHWSQKIFYAGRKKRRKRKERESNCTNK
jgi:hypothetical protein